MIISDRHKASPIYTHVNQLVEAAEPVQLQHREDMLSWLSFFQ